MSRHVAIDIGTSGGKVVLGSTNDDALDIQDVYRFDDGWTIEDGDRVWDVEFLIDEIVTGLARAEDEVGRIDSVGIDATAGVFGFVKDGELMGDPIHRRGAVPDHISREDAFFDTGHGRLPDTYYSLYRDRPALIESADALLLFPQLVAYELGGEPCGELTYAISAGLGNTRTRSWAVEVVEAFGLPIDPLPALAPVGSTIGTVDAAVSNRLESTPEIVVVPGHDTSSAVAAIPFEDGRGFLATGSWFIPGLELDEPVISREAFDIPAENMGGIDGTARFVRNVPGFSLFEHCRTTWRETGGIHDYDHLLDAAAEAPAFGSLVDVGDPRFVEGHAEGDVVERIEAYCRETGQDVPQDEGAITRCLFESLAAESAVIFDQLLAAADTEIEQLHVVGGGVRNPLLCGMLASATGLPIQGGPVEATAIGNLLIQLQSFGEIGSIAEGRELVRERVAFERYEPRESDGWDEARCRMRTLLSA